MTREFNTLESKQPTQWLETMITLNAIVPNSYIDENNTLVEIRIPKIFSVSPALLRDSSAVRRLIVDLAGAEGRRSALRKENCGFAAPTPGRHISTFCGYQILFSIRNPYINRFTNHFSIHLLPSYPQKVVLHSMIN